MVEKSEADRGNLPKVTYVVKRFEFKADFRIGVTNNYVKCFPANQTHGRNMLIEAECPSCAIF